MVDISIPLADQAYTLAGATSPRTESERNFDVINAMDFGARPYPEGNAAKNFSAIQTAIDRMTPDTQVVLPARGTYYIDRTLNMSKGFVGVNIAGRLSADDSFVGDYLIDASGEAQTPYYTWPVRMSAQLDCRFVTRGIRSTNADHNDWMGVRIERPYGQGIKLDRWRESTLYSPKIINGAARLAFVTPADYNPVAAYVPGNYTRWVDSDWNGATAYVPGDIVRRLGSRYMAALAGMGNDPAAGYVYWVKIPHEDYLCISPATGLSPQTFNMNNATPANRKWQKVYQDESGIEINDSSINSSDRSNQIVLYSPVVRDCGFGCMVRIDNNKNSVPNTHIDIVNGHLHNTNNSQTAYPQVTTSELQRVIEIGFAHNVNIENTNIRMWEGPRNIGVMIGDGGATKQSTSTTLKAAISGEASGQVGVIVMPSTVSGGGRSNLTPNFLLTTDFTEIIDPNRYFRKEFDVEVRTDIKPGLNSTPSNFSTFVDPAYTIARTNEFRFNADVNPRFRTEMTTTRTSHQWGDGTSAPDVTFYRSAANIQEFGAGDSLRALGGFGSTALAAEPTTKWAGLMALANRTGWDPLAKGSGGAYWVWWTGAAWVAPQTQA